MEGGDGNDRREERTTSAVTDWRHSGEREAAALPQDRGGRRHMPALPVAGHMSCTQRTS